jgi:hypothetical protein
VPFAAADLLRFIDEAMGKLDNPNTSAPYLRLRTRLESLRTDRRYAFLFSDSVAIRDTLSRIVGRLLRIPVNGKPLTIVDLSGVPAEVTDVVVSLVCRLIFNFALWADRKRLPPVLLVCEEAHRYVPASEPIGFGATSRAIARIAREGRKYGVSLALISRTPLEISSQVLSQCGTVFAMRLGHHLDQTFTGAAWPDAARGMLEALPSMRKQEAIASEKASQCRCASASMTGRRIAARAARAPNFRTPGSDCGDAELLEEGIRCWRGKGANSLRHRDLICVRGTVIGAGNELSGRKSPFG